MGGLRKRPGLLKINTNAVSGSVFGICNVPIAPITLRRFLIGIDQDVTSAHQWLTSTDAFGTVTTATAPAACARPSSDTVSVFINNQVLSNRGTQIENTLLYPGDYTRGNPQPIRAYDGTIDRELFRIPLNPHAVADFGANYGIYPGQVLDWAIHGSKLYFVSLDLVQVGFVSYSRIMEYNLETGGMQQIGEATGNGTGEIGSGAVVFSCVTMHQGSLYAGVVPLSSGWSSAGSGVYRIRPGVDTTWTYDFDNSGVADGDFEVSLSMASYKGLLYVGMHDLNSGSSRLMVRGTDGSYSQSTTVGNGNGSGWPRMLVFGDNLYACSLDNNGASSITRIHKFDGSSWSVVKTIDTGTATPRIGVAMLVHNSVLYVLAIAATQNAVVTYSSDGTSWTDQNSNMTGGDILSIFGVFTD